MNREVRSSMPEKLEGNPKECLEYSEDFKIFNKVILELV